MENFGIFHGHLVYYEHFWYSVGPFGIFVAILVHFSRLGLLCQAKSGNPGTADGKSKLCGRRLINQFSVTRLQKFSRLG
jgi:hypothetical protein